MPPRESIRPFVPGTKGRTFRGTTRLRQSAAPRPTGLSSPIGAARYRWRPAPEPTGRGVHRVVRSGGSRVHSPSPSSRFPPATGSLCRRATGTRPDHRPRIRDVPGESRGPLRRRQPTGPRLGGRRADDRTSPSLALLRRLAHGRPPVARTQAPGTVGMGQARRPELVRDLEDALVVGPAGGAAGRPDELRFAGHGRQAAQGGCDGLAIEGRRSRPAAASCCRPPRTGPRPGGGGCGRRPPSACPGGPPEPPGPRRSGRGPGPIEPSPRIERGCSQALAPVDGAPTSRASCSQFRRWRVQVCSSTTRATLGFEDLHGRFGQVDRPALRMADDDPAPAARTEPGAGRRRIEDNPAIRTGDGRHRRGRGRAQASGRLEPAIDRRRQVAAGAVQAEEPAQERDRTTSLAGPGDRSASGYPDDPAVGPDGGGSAGVRSLVGSAARVSGGPAAEVALHRPPITRRRGPSGSGTGPVGSRRGAGAAGGARC